jgi:ribosomal protein S18 acetylase RimI-like enzyme
MRAAQIGAFSPPPARKPGSADYAGGPRPGMMSSMPAGLAFRAAATADVPAVVALVESAYRGEASRVGWTTEADLLDGRRTDADAVATIIESPRARMLLATRDDVGEVVACCQLEQARAGVAYFGMFAVRPAQQGAGIGNQLLLEAERFVRAEWAAAEMEMSVIEQRTELIAWYARRGYRPTGQTRPFPYGDERFGLPRRPDLRVMVLAKPLR